MSALKAGYGKQEFSVPTEKLPNRVDLEERANRGQEEDVDYLMSFLFKEQTLAVCKLIDFVLSLVVTYHGRRRIRYYLFNGSRMQRNYAALFFKRLGNHKKLLRKAVKQGCIEEEFAFVQ